MLQSLLLCACLFLNFITHIIYLDLSKAPPTTKVPKEKSTTGIPTVEAIKGIAEDVTQEPSHSLKKLMEYVYSVIRKEWKEHQTVRLSDSCKGKMQLCTDVYNNASKDSLCQDKAQPSGLVVATVDPLWVGNAWKGASLGTHLGAEGL
ncbi:hypothetical protein ElyMa_002497800 [Elysia marginata]|uniref:Uncharacterized protein n=1 Tax=Elysia marginata TaxID=1093978 RepID=A0AAV4GR34_9GAST|nr:hypothetical protein ElyMa_002497800 [Elysia marginata]